MRVLHILCVYIVVKYTNKITKFKKKNRKFIVICSLCLTAVVMFIFYYHDGYWRYSKLNIYTGQCIGRSKTSLTILPVFTDYSFILPVFKLQLCSTLQVPMSLVWPHTSMSTSMPHRMHSKCGYWQLCSLLFSMKAWNFWYGLLYSGSCASPCVFFSWHLFFLITILGEYFFYFFKQVCTCLCILPPPIPIC